MSTGVDFVDSVSAPNLRTKHNIQYKLINMDFFAFSVIQSRISTTYLLVIVIFKIVIYEIVIDR
jgi:hypothetical protein